MRKICPDRIPVRLVGLSAQSEGPTRIGAWPTLMALVVAGAFAPATAQAADRNIQFELGFGAQYVPVYEGADVYTAQPTGMAALNSLSFGSMRFAGSQDPSGFSVAPSFRYIGARKSAGYPILAGLPDNKATVEIGVKALYHWNRYSAYTAVRKGIGGHRGTVGELGVEAEFDITKKTNLTLGSVASFADTRAMGFAFDVPATAVNLSRYNAGGGVKSVGLAAEMRHQLTDKTALVGTLGWNRLIRDAGNSPIVSSGSKNQFSVGVMLVREFNLRF